MELGLDNPSPAEQSVDVKGDSTEVSQEVIFIFENKYGLWMKGPDCELKKNSSDALIKEWALQLHGLTVEKIERGHHNTVVWSKKGVRE